MTCTRRAPALFSLIVLAAAADARASFPAGVWGLVEEVKLEPSGDNPSTMRIDGLFMVANQQPDFPQQPGYSLPQYGYINYACLAKQLETCAMEWNELLAIAGTADNCRGWGDNSFEINGTVHPVEEPSESSEVYPVSMGILNGVGPCQALRDWQVEHPEPAGSTGEPDATGPDTTGAPATTASETGTPGGSSSDAPTGGSPTDSASAGSTSAASETIAGDDTPSDKGCACDTHGAGGLPDALALLAGFGLLARRRRAVSNGRGRGSVG